MIQSSGNRWESVAGNGSKVEVPKTEGLCWREVRNEETRREFRRLEGLDFSLHEDVLAFYTERNKTLHKV